MVADVAYTNLSVTPIVTSKILPTHVKLICAVCGDDSTGFHYEVLSCNGCKTFFRRTIVTKRSFKCHKNGECRFSKEHRCACRSCRFNKCLQVGMNPEAIQSTRRTSSLTPTLTSSCSSQTCNRKRGYNISSLLNDAPSHDPPVTSRSSSPASSAGQNPFRTKSCHNELNERTARLVNIEERLNCLRNSAFKPTINLNDLVIMPRPLENTKLYKLPWGNADVNWDKELYLRAEYAKMFTWFQEMHVVEQLAVFVERLFPMAVMHVAVELAKTDASTATSQCLRSTIAALRRVAIDSTAFAILNAIVFTGSNYSHFDGNTSALQRDEREKNVDALGLYLFKRYQSEGASRMADHLSIVWSLLNDCRTLREHLLNTLSSSSLTSYILNLQCYLS